jgi:hypothetical protein
VASEQVVKGFTKARVKQRQNFITFQRERGTDTIGSISPVVVLDRSF